MSVAYAAMAERVRAELVAAGVGPAHPALDGRVQRIVSAVSRFVLKCVGG